MCQNKSLPIDTNMATIGRFAQNNINLVWVHLLVIFLHLLPVNYKRVVSK